MPDMQHNSSYTNANSRKMTSVRCFATIDYCKQPFCTAAEKGPQHSRRMDTCPPWGQPASQDCDSNILSWIAPFSSAREQQITAQNNPRALSELGFPKNSIYYLLRCKRHLIFVLEALPSGMLQGDLTLLETLQGTTDQ